MIAAVRNGTVFPGHALDRGVIPWQKFMNELTPIQEGGGLLWKREDYFAPLGYGGINGAKLRQLLHLVGQYVGRGGRAGILTGASVLSPQVSMAALVARHFDLPCRVVLGATKPETAARHENVAIAAAAGAEFVYTPVGFNPALQRAVALLHDETPDWYRLCYGITTPAEDSDSAIHDFHLVGGWQTENVEDVDTLVMTAGSCNSCVSVLYGLAVRRPERLSRVVLLGVGPTRLEWIERRLAALERAGGVPLRSVYRRRYHHHPDLEHEHQTDGPILLEHWDLHSTGWTTYQSRMPASYAGIDFHPTYEGKAMHYLWENPDIIDADERTLFWIVGSEPTRRAMQDAFILGGLV